MGFSPTLIKFCNQFWAKARFSLLFHHRAKAAMQLKKHSKQVYLSDY
jgi:hypothetical protein